MSREGVKAKQPYAGPRSSIFHPRWNSFRVAPRSIIFANGKTFQVSPPSFDCSRFVAVHVWCGGVCELCVFVFSVAVGPSSTPPHTPHARPRPGAIEQPKRELGWKLPFTTREAVRTTRQQSSESGEEDPSERAAVAAFRDRDSWSKSEYL